METKAGKTGVTKTKGRGGQRRSWKKMRRKGKEEAKREKDGRSKKNSKRVGNLG